MKRGRERLQRSRLGTSSITRRPGFAGPWYPGGAESLRRAVEGYISAGGSASPALGLVSPHAGYKYSGAVAGKGYAAVEVPATVVVLGPAHRYASTSVAVWDGGSWQTPLGEIEIDTELRQALLDALRDTCPEAEGDSASHVEEHSLELQIPFLQVRRPPDVKPELRIVPVVVATHEPRVLRSLGEGIAKAFKTRGEDPDALIVASSDMTHYETAASAEEKDSLALERVEALDPEGLLEVVMKRPISMCGVAPVAAMLYAAKVLGASRAERAAYATSGDVTGDMSEVVGYAAVTVRR